ncbi:MAG: hypothetical protein LKE20_08640 [Limosilactobacillus oris]|uniref:hypothetical protein n=1 Tax=Limosilactobacillus oris TaxID=1632 RepID=UPI0024316246|nr:hypothetical protein [Limosilactobacillus oris]MCH3910264.1 hypothetical protein [Limosilactobacillus oris]MCH3939391.1 hypothetical protein [Limosilactobacillus oris]MCI1980731.1 hypothetical protein [Limosilactobacillus oris]MCI2043125.1 hypothetical protein [Limosilactobacillus oris]
MGKSLFDNKLDIGRGIFYCSFICAVVLSFILGSNYVPLISGKVVHWMLYIVIATVLVKIYAIDENSLKDTCLKTAIILVAVVSWRLVKNVNVLLYIVFILGAKDIDFRKIVQLFFGVIGILLVGTIIISQASIVTDYIYIRDGHDRHSLGISYPTDMAAYVFYLLLAYYYLAFDKITWKSYLGVIVIDFIVYELTQARNTAILIMVTIPVILIAKRASRGYLVSRGIASFYWMITPLAAYCTALLAYLYNKNSRLLVLANRALSGRLELSHRAIDKYGFSLFGQHVKENGWGGVKGFKNFHNPNFSYFYIDSSYMRLAVIYGMVIAIIIITFMTIIAYRSTARREFTLAAIIMLVSIHCIVEQHLLDLNYDPFLLALFASFPNNLKSIHIPGGNHEEK